MTQDREASESAMAALWRTRWMAVFLVSKSLNRVEKIPIVWL